MSLCEHQALLTAYLMGDLPERDAAALRAHLETCAACRATADELRTTLALLGEALAPSNDAEAGLCLDAARRKALLSARPPRDTWFTRRHPRLSRLAAEIVIVVGVLSVLSTMLFPAVSNSTKVAKRTAARARQLDEALNAGCGVVGMRSAHLYGREGTASSLSYAEREPAPVSAPAAASVPAAVAPSKARRLERYGFDDTAARTVPGVAHRPQTPEVAYEKAKTLFDANGLGDRDGDKAVSWLHEAKQRGQTEAKPAGRMARIAGDFSGGERASAGVAQKPASQPEGKVRLNIELPKPAFTGTPKDLRSPNLEAAQERLAESPERQVKREAEPLSGPTEVVLSDAPAAAPSETPSVLGRAFALKSPMVLKGVYASRVDAAKEQRKAEAKADAKEAERKDAWLESDVSVTVEEPQASQQSDVSELKKTVQAVDKEVSSGTKLGVAARPAPLPVNPFVSVAASPLTTFAMDVDTASYTLTRQAIRAGALPEPERVRTEEIVNAFDYGDAAPDRTVFRIYQDGAQSRFGAGYHLLRIGVKGRRLGREEQRPAMLTFVIDVSGSMAQPDRIGLARLALKLLLEQLSERDRIQLIAYSDHARLMLEPVAASAKAQVLAAFEQLQCNGSTNLEEGLRQAYEQASRTFVPGGENRVILISDGVANLGADSAREILDKVAASRKQGITCSVFGVGAGTYNDRMLEELANKGDGVYRFLDSEEEVRTAFVDDLAATLNTIAKDAKIQVEWNPGAVRQYRQLGYENRALRNEQFRDDSVDAGEVGSGQSVSALYELDLAPDVAPAALLGTVRIRYQRTDTGKVEEFEAPLLAQTVLQPAHQASAHFRVAACAAEFAEQLRRSPFAAGTSLQDVADYLRPAALELALDTRVKELLELVLAAAALMR